MGGKYGVVLIPAGSYADIIPASGEHWLMLAESLPGATGDQWVFPSLIDSSTGVSAVTLYNGLQEIQYFINSSVYLRVHNTYTSSKYFRYQASASDVPTIVGAVSVPAGSYVAIYPLAPYFRIARLASGAGSYGDVLVYLYSPEGTKTLLQQPSSGFLISPSTWSGCVCIGAYPQLRMRNNESSSRDLCYSMTGNIG